MDTVSTQEQVDSFLGLLDTGPTTCLFQELLTTNKRQQTNSLFPWLGFVQELKFRAQEFTELLALYNSAKDQNPALHRQLIPYSVAKWIYHTNKLEFAAALCEEDTRGLILQYRQGESTSSGDKDVLQTLALLKATYTDRPELRSRAWTPSDLTEWHSKLFNGILSFAGQFRRSGVETKNLDETRHLYPHHGIIPSSIGSLAKVVSGLGKTIEDTYPIETAERVLYTFALAAFAQFHFVDIHPFIDGNGRMCRFISKFFLDSLCPVPFPMFEDRDLYLQALIGARSASPESAPLLLARLLFDSAIDYYRSLLKNHYNKGYDRVLCCTSEKEFERSLGDIKDLTEENKEKLMASWRELAEGGTVDCVGVGMTCRIRRLTDWDIDNL